MAPATGAPVVEVDTEGAVSGDGPRGTADRAATSDTNQAGGHIAAYANPTAQPVTGVDTTAANGGRLVNSLLGQPVSLLNTLAPGTGGIPEANPAYRAPGGPVAASSKDTTLTDKQPGGALVDPTSTAANMTSSPDSYNIGAAGSGTGSTSPAAPTSITAVTGPRGITVGWVAPSDPSGDEVLDYVIRCVEDDGVTFAPRGATSVFCDWLTPDRTYTFKVAARNKHGLGVMSAASSPAVRPYNPDAPLDPLDPFTGGLTPANRIDPVYNPDGSFKAGTGGTNSPPLSVTATAGAGASRQITVAWAAPTYGNAPTGYHIICSDATTYDVAGNVFSKLITFGASGGAAKKFTVNAVNAIGSGQLSASPAGVVSP